MATNRILPPGDEHTVLFTATTTARSSGDVVLITEMIGVCLMDIAAAGTGPVQTEGVFNLTKSTAAAFAQGDSVYWDVTDGNFNLVATANYFAGKVHVATTAGDTDCYIRLNFGNAGPR